MSQLPGVFAARKKDGTEYYRVSITCKGKHISLGSFDDAEKGAQAYEQARFILFGGEDNAERVLLTPEDYPEDSAISFEKWVMLTNFAANGIYCRNPIYLRNKYFLYYLSNDTVLKFDADDLFYYMNHKIMKRGGHLFVADYGMQVSVLSRYGIRPFAVQGRDYVFKNGDNTDFRYGNLELINHYSGVTAKTKKGKTEYTARIHVRSTYVVGHYDTEEEAAIAYNKAADLLRSKGYAKEFQDNYIEDLSEIEYRLLYKSVRLSRSFLRNFP